MENPQNIKKRLKSVKNINQITRAMELVAATKMRKSQQIALDSRPYAFAALGLLAHISKLKGKVPALLKKREERKTLYVLATSDKGLAGAFNSSLFRKFDRFIFENKIELDQNCLFVAVGEKSFSYLKRKGIAVLEKFVHVGDFTLPEQTKILAEFLANGYLEKKWDSVVVFSTHFRSALKQEARARKILPIDFEDIKKTAKEIIPEKGKFADLIKEHQIDFISQDPKIYNYLIEPSPKTVLDNLTRHLFSMQVYHIILEANASEHAARRLAMKTASDNASELGFELTLLYNKSRQALITKEISEITSGSESLSQN